MLTVLLVMEIFAFIVTLLSALYPARWVISPLVFEARVINTLWSVRTEALTLEEYLSTVTVSSLTGEVKDILIDEGVRFSGEKKPEVVDDAREDVLHCCYLLSRFLIFSVFNVVIASTRKGEITSSSCLLLPA